MLPRGARARQPPEGAEPIPWHPQLLTSHSDATRWGPTGPGTASLSLGNARPLVPGPLPTSFLLGFCFLSRVEAAGAGRLACPDSLSSGLCARAWRLGSVAPPRWRQGRDSAPQVQGLLPRLRGPMCPQASATMRTMCSGRPQISQTS